MAPTKPHLAAINGSNVETSAERARRLLAEASEAGDALTLELMAAMHAAMVLARQASLAGEAVQPGVRNVCRTVADDLTARLNTIEALRGRK